MKTIYAVNSGQYSDYRIVALFSTKEKAEEFMQFVPYDDYNDIEEYALNPNAPDMIRRGYKVWKVIMLRDGTTEKVYETEMDYYDIQDVGHHIWVRSKAPAYRDGTPDALISNVWAKNETSAIKIANEHRIQMIANNEW